MVVRRVIAPLAMRSLFMSRSLHRHGFGDHAEVRRRDREQAEAEHAAPALLVANEGQVPDQRTDRCFARQLPFYASAPRPEPATHIDLGRSRIGHLPGGRECLDRFARAHLLAGGIVDDPVARPQTRGRRLLAMAKLAEPSVDPTPDVLTAGNADPVTRRAHAGSPNFMTRRRWPSGSRPRKVRPKSRSAGAAR